MYKDINNIGKEVHGVDAIKNSIRNILMTTKGSLPGKPTFGSSLNNIIFNQLDYVTIDIAKNYVREAIDEFEPRVTIDSINISKVEEYNKMVIDITFSYTDKDLNNEINQNGSLSVSLST